jgi:NAD(P)-dependent dehydrogenase (short-subunit alcohol dehydrogenase family)
MGRSLQGKVALVTGGSSGIGLAAAKRLAAEGATVFIAGRRQAELDSAVADIGGDVIAIQTDVSKNSDLDRLYEAVRAAKGKLDIVFANAGVQVKQRLDAITEDALELQLAINFKGTVFTVQKALPLLNEGASIILTSSVTAIKGLADRTVYSATKAAIRSFARTWVTELKGRHIRVNVLSPGPVATPGVKAGLTDEKAVAAYQAAVVGTIPMGRIGTSEEMAEIVLFLASDASAYINGADIQADGGLAQI